MQVDNHVDKGQRLKAILFCCGADENDVLMSRIMIMQGSYQKCSIVSWAMRG